MKLISTYLHSKRPYTIAIMLCLLIALSNTGSAQILSYTTSTSGALNLVAANATGTALAFENGATKPSSLCSTGFSSTTYSSTTTYSCGTIYTAKEELPGIEQTPTITETENGIAVYPNPSQGAFTIQIWYQPTAKCTDKDLQCLRPVSNKRCKQRNAATGHASIYFHSFRAGHVHCNYNYW